MSFVRFPFFVANLHGCLPAIATSLCPTCHDNPRYICVREKVGEKFECVIIDMANPSSPQRREMSADSVIMNPDSQIIALKSAKTLQIFNMATRQKLKAYTLPENVEHWRWVRRRRLIPFICLLLSCAWDCRVHLHLPTHLTYRGGKWSRIGGRGDRRYGDGQLGVPLVAGGRAG